jgi:putative ABC transport system permease protein
MFWSTLVMALRQIYRNKLRSGLTALGVIIGVAAVIAMVTVGRGATAQIQGQISALGDNLLILIPGTHDRGSSRTAAKAFELEDVEAIRESIKGVAATAPVSMRPVVAVRGSTNWPTTVTGVSPEYFPVRKYEIARGRGIEDSDESKSVCVLGATTSEELFGNDDALGETIRLGRTTCSVVGILKSKGSSGQGDDDDTVLMPLRDFQRRLSGNLSVQVIYMSVSDTHSPAAVRRQIEHLMRERRGIEEGASDDFQVMDMAEVVQTVSKVSDMLMGLLGAIAAVSLLVGGIGIMNIMLVSVTERTREIGIRLALGALGREVLLQFLIEAMALSALGGVLGIGVGLAGAKGITGALEFPFAIDLSLVALAFFFSVAVGVVFGFLPASKASRLHPIEALRHE